MKKVVPLKKVYADVRSQAEFLFSREFNSVALELLGEVYENIMYPDDEVFLDDFKYEMDTDDLREEYEELFGKDYTEFDFDTWLLETSEFRGFVQDVLQEHYPMWGWVFQCDRFYIDSDYMDVNKLYKLGIGVIDHETGYYLFIAGAGYDFYDAHWIPLFRELGWIKDYSEEVLQKIEELEKAGFIVDNSSCLKNDFIIINKLAAGELKYYVTEKELLTFKIKENGSISENQ